MAEKEKEEAQEKPKGSKTLLIFGAVALVLLIGVGVGAYFLGTRMAPAPDVPAETAAAGTPAAKKPDAKVSAEIGPMIDIENFVVNLLDKENTRYLKASVTLELNSPETSEEVTQRMAQIRDAILLLSSNKTFDDLRDLQGKMQLRAELIETLNKILLQGKVTHVYFTNFVIQ